MAEGLKLKLFEEFAKRGCTFTERDGKGNAAIQMLLDADCKDRDLYSFVLDKIKDKNSYSRVHISHPLQYSTQLKEMLGKNGYSETKPEL